MMDKYQSSPGIDDPVDITNTDEFKAFKVETQACEAQLRDAVDVLRIVNSDWARHHTRESIQRAPEVVKTILDEVNRRLSKALEQTLGNPAPERPTRSFSMER